MFIYPLVLTPRIMTMVKMKIGKHLPAKVKMEEGKNKKGKGRKVNEGRVIFIYCVSFLNSFNNKIYEWSLWFGVTYAVGP